MKARLAFAFLVTLGSAACNKGTYVVLDFTSGPSNVTAIDCTLTLGGKTASTSFGKKSETLGFPLRGALQIENGTGTLDVDCAALANGATVGETSGTVMVVHDESETLELSFGGGGDMPVPDLADGGGGDAGDAFVPREGLSISPNTYDYGTLVVNTTSSANAFTVTNTGNEPTGQLTATVNGAGFAKDSSSNCDGVVLQPMQTCTVAVTFTPAGATTVSGTINVTYSGLDPGSAANASLMGTGATPGSLSWSIAKQDFGSALENTIGASFMFTLTNNGESPTSTIATSITGTDSTAFSLTMDACNNMTLGAGASCQVTAQFEPDARGKVSVSLLAVATTGGTAALGLSGTGEAPATLELVGAASQGSPFNFGLQLIETMSATQQSFTLENSGDVSTSAYTISESSGDITIDSSSTCDGTALAAGGSCSVVVDFMPSAIGLGKDTITFAAATGGTVKDYVEGTGYDNVTVAVTSNGVNGGSGTVTSDDGNFNCGDGNLACEHTYERTGAFNITFTATATTDGSMFEMWGYENSPPACAEGTASMTCTTTFATTVTANTSGTPYEYDATFSM